VVVPHDGRLVPRYRHGNVRAARAVSAHNRGDGAAVRGQGVDRRARRVGREGQNGRQGPDVDHGVRRAREEEVGRGVDGEGRDGLQMRRGRGDEAAGAYLLRVRALHTCACCVHLN
jgi:hypothetical protein